MPNQFYVAPASSGALKGLTDGLQGLTAYNQNQNEIGRQDAAKQEAKQAQQADAELVKQIQGKDPEALFALMQTNPQLAQNVMKATGFIDGQQRQASADSMLEYLGGGDVEQAVMTQVEVLKQMGKDPKAVLQWGLMPEGEQKRKFAETALALNATPEQWNRYQQMTGKVKKQEDGRTAGMKDFDYYQELKKSDPESAKAFGVERGFITKEGMELSSHMQKRLSAATDTAIESEANASRFEVLASDIEGADIGGGLFGGTWKEALKEVTGTQDAVSDLRRKYAGIRASQVVNNLPPGAASDKDIELAMGGFPSDKASGQQLASFIRGMAKLEKVKADYENFKADFISENGSERGMLQEWKSTNEEMPKKTTSANQKESSGAAQYPEGTLIRNPSTGQEMIMRGGEWVAK